MKNVLKIEKNEELNYEFGKQNPTSTKLVGFFVCALRDVYKRQVLCKLKADTVISIQSDRNCQNKRFQKVCFRKLEQT